MLQSTLLVLLLVRVLTFPIYDARIKLIFGGNQNRGSSVVNPSFLAPPLSATVTNHQNPNPGKYDTNRAVETLKNAKANNNAPKFTAALKALAGNNILEKKDFSSAILPILTDVVDECNLNSSEVSLIIWSLPKLGFKLKDLRHHDVCMKLVHQLCADDLNSLTPRIVTTSLGGLSNLHMNWGELPPGIQDDIVLAVGAVCNELNEREMCNIIHSLSKLEIPWSTLPHGLQSGLLNGFVRHKNIGAQEAAMSIYALGVMGLQLNAIAPALRDRLFAVALSSLKGGKARGVHISVSQQVSNIIYGLAKLNVTVREEPLLPTYLKEGILGAVENIMGFMNEQEVANTVYSLGLMGFSWSSLDADMSKLIEHTLTLRLRKMITQGVSNSLYGMFLLGADWNDMSAEYKETVKDACVSKLQQFSQPSNGGVSIVNKRAPQSVANIVYSLGLCNAKWSELDMDLRGALFQGIVRDCSVMKPQEVSNAIYGLGVMRVELQEIPSEVQDVLVGNFGRVALQVNQMELCQVLNGFAKMNAVWDELPVVLKRNLVIAIVRHAGLMKDLCLACAFYALGAMSATWSLLPAKLVSSLIQCAQSIQIRDQTFSNLIIGLTAMKVQWDKMEDEMREVILTNLANPLVFAQDISQHIGNTFWGLGKLDADWESLPQDVMQDAFLRCKTFSSQELTNVIYGLAVMDASWASLRSDFRKALTKELLICKELLVEDTPAVSQEIANIMYSTAILTFDYPIDNPVAKEEVLELHRRLLDLYFRRTTGLVVAEEEIQNQFSIYLEYISAAFPTLITEVHGPWIAPLACAGDTSSSGFHLRAVESMMQALGKLSPHYTVVNEFTGLDSGAFPIDAAVYHKGKLVALIEIDGEFHYRSFNQQLRRKDRLKEYLYSIKFPDIPLFRIRQDQCAVIGVDRAGRALAKWISAIELR